MTSLVMRADSRRLSRVRAALAAGLAVIAYAWAALPLLNGSDAAAAPATSAPAATRPSTVPADDFVLRSYHVADLIERTSATAAPDGAIPPTIDGRFVGGGGWVGGGGGLAADRSVMSGEALTAVVREVVAPGSWGEAGGRVAVNVVGGRMVVRQRADAHREVVELLAVLRAGRRDGAALAVDGWWLLLTPAESAALLGPADAPARAVDPAALAKLPPAAVPATVTLRCRSGTWTDAAAGDARSTVVDVNPSVGLRSDLDPDIRRLLYGATLSLRATLLLDAVDAEVTATFSESNADPGAGRNGPTTRPATGPAATVLRGGGGGAGGGGGGRQTLDPFVVDRVDANVHHVGTSARLPLGKPTVVGAMTLRPRSAGDADRRQLVFVMRVRAE